VKLLEKEHEVRLQRNPQKVVNTRELQRVLIVIEESPKVMKSTLRTL
jgi:hypothetical protein